MALARNNSNIISLRVKGKELHAIDSTIKTGILRF